VVATSEIVGEHIELNAATTDVDERPLPLKARSAKNTFKTMAAGLQVASSSCNQ